MIYSLLITTRRFRRDPAAWLSNTLRRTPTCTQDNLSELLPWNWNHKSGLTAADPDRSGDHWPPQANLEACPFRATSQTMGCTRLVGSMPSP